MGFQAIANKLTELKIPTLFNSDWHASSIRTILQNEKYIGNMILQKTYVDNHINKKKCINNGELPMYMVQNSHTAIIDKEIFDKVQEMIEQRQINKGVVAEKHVFTGRITCGICGKNYRRKTSGGGTKYSKVVWSCATYNTKGKKYCSSKQIPEAILLDIVPEDFLHIKAYDNVLEVTLSDNSVKKISWSNKSRSESWNDEMRENARKRSKKCNQQLQ